MAKLKAKQLYFSSVSQLIVGNAQGSGTYLSAGASGSVLRVNGSDLNWSILDIISDVLQENSVQASADGISVNLGSDENDPKLLISATGTTVEIAADGSTEDIVLVPGANGNVIIAGDGEGVIEAEDGEDLTIKGGSGAGNLFLGAGATGKVYYAEDATDPSLEVATIGTVQDGVSAAVKRDQFAGNVTPTIPVTAVPDSVEIYINGLILGESAYTIVAGTITIDTEALGYPLDSDDLIVVNYLDFA